MVTVVAFGKISGSQSGIRKRAVVIPGMKKWCLEKEEPQEKLFFQGNCEHFQEEKAEESRHGGCRVSSRASASGGLVRGFALLASVLHLLGPRDSAGIEVRAGGGGQGQPSACTSQSLTWWTCICN